MRVALAVACPSICEGTEILVKSHLMRGPSPTKWEREGPTAEQWEGEGAGRARRLDHILSCTALIIAADRLQLRPVRRLVLDELVDVRGDTSSARCVFRALSVPRNSGIPHNPFG
jgi:hypothetical protein